MGRGRSGALGNGTHARLMAQDTIKKENPKGTGAVVAGCGLALREFLGVSESHAIHSSVFVMLYYTSNSIVPKGG